MDRVILNRRRALALAGVSWFGTGATASAQRSAAPATPPAGRNHDAGSETHPLPAEATTHHTLDLPGRVLHFSARAGSIKPTLDRTAPVAEIAFIAFQLETTGPAQRPVTFVFNGGPGFASGWLNVGAVGPWRIALGDRTTSPSAPAEPVANAETWLDFTDLVFIDPAGTGYSQILTTNDEQRRNLWSVEGDIAYLAEVIRRWLDRFDRGTSPKYILGESYGGFRAPRLARELASNQGTGVAGLVLLSPALEIPSHDSAFDPFFYVTRLPSMVAAARALRGPVTREQLADAEHYAATDYLVDVTRGERDVAAIERRSTRVAELTGLDPALVRRYHGLLDTNVFLHALEGAQHRVGSHYDALITSADPFPLATLSNPPDPILEGLQAPVSTAMVSIYHDRLHWRPDTPYQLGDTAISRKWNWGHGVGSPPQSLNQLRTALALDANFSVLVAHGLFDLVTPYFATQLLLDQISGPAGADRMQFNVHSGGHMFYANDASRAVLHDNAAKLIGRV